MGVNSDLPKVISKMKFVTGLLTIAVLAFFTGVEVKAKPQSVNANIKVSVNGGDKPSVTKQCGPEDPECDKWCDENCFSGGVEGCLCVAEDPPWCTDDCRSKEAKVSVNGVDQQASVTTPKWCIENCPKHCKSAKCNSIAQTCDCFPGKNATGSALQGKNVYRAGASCQCPNCCAGHYCDQGISNWGIKICVPN